MEVKLNRLRICYAPGLFTARAFEEGKTPKFGCQLILPHKDTAQIAKVKAAIEQVAKEKWAAKGAGVIASLQGTDFLCLREGAKKPDREELENADYIAASNKVRPTIVDRDRTPLTEADGKPYSGCYVNAKIDIYGFEINGKKMICATLMGVQFVENGDAFSGASVMAADEFDDLADTGDDDLV